MTRSTSRWILIGSILGSGAVFVEGTVTTVALPAIAHGLGLGVSGLQWVMNGYLLTLSALILFGGALGDRYARHRVFAIGLVGFAIASLACAVAPTLLVLVIARIVQGAMGALVVPNSLALLETAYTGEARGAAIGRWAAWSGVSTALGPLAGGWLVDATSWRIVFVCVAPFALAAAAVVASKAGDRGDATRAETHVDYAGAALATLALAGLVGALMLGPDRGYGSPVVLITGAAGVVLLAAFLVVEHRAPQPLLPLDVFRSRQFTGVNATTLLLYAALSGLFFLLMLQLQTVLGLSARVAGASLLPINVLMLLLSPYAGRFAERHGPRTPMVAGALVAGVATLLFTRVQAGASYATSVIPATIVFGLGLACFVAPLTSVALGALEAGREGLASGVNNAVARLAGLLATAIIPVAAGLGGAHNLQPREVASGFTRAMIICAVLCGAAAGIAAMTMGVVRTAKPGRAR